jgi:hypothetical protein
MQVFEHAQITKKHHRQPFYYSRWFRCMNNSCKTSTVMPDRYRVWNIDGEDRTNLESWLGKQNNQRRVDRETGQADDFGRMLAVKINPHTDDSWDDGDTSGPPPWE